MSITIRLKRGTRSQIDSATLQTGEPAFATDTNELVIQGISSKVTIGKNADTVDNYHVDATGATTGQLVQFDTANVKLSATPIYVVSGKVGIGTTAPARQLHISGDNAVFRMDRSVDTTSFMLVRIDSSGNPLKTFVVGTNATGSNNGEFIISDLGAEVAGTGNRRLTIDNNGNIGVGITSPSQKLHVSGNIGIQAGANAFIGTLDNYILSLRTNNTDRVIVDTSGNVGIGATPSYKLDVGGDIRSISSGYIRIHPASSDSDMSFIRLVNTASSTTNPYVNFGYGSYTGICGVYMAISDKSLRLNVSKTSDGANLRDAIIIPPANGTQTACIIPSSGGSYVSDWPSGWGGGISTCDICCSGVYYGTLTQRSDANLKTDVQPLSDYLNTDCLDVISCLKPIKYVYVDDPLKTNRFGFIAQDVSEICPELVTVDSEGKASLNYMDLIALLTKGIQELYNMVTSITKVNTT